MRVDENPPMESTREKRERAPSDEEELEKILSRRCSSSENPIGHYYPGLFI